MSLTMPNWRELMKDTCLSLVGFCGINGPTCSLDELFSGCKTPRLWRGASQNKKFKLLHLFGKNLSKSDWQDKIPVVDYILRCSGIPAPIWAATNARYILKIGFLSHNVNNCWQCDGNPLDQLAPLIPNQLMLAAAMDHCSIFRIMIFILKWFSAMLSV